jgi:glucokinase
MSPTGNPSVTVGIDVGGTKILGALLDEGREDPVLELDRVPTPAGGDEVVAAAVAMTRRLTPDGSTLAAVGMGIPGIVDRNGTLRFGPHLPGVTNFPFAQRLSEELNAPATTVNDASAAAYAEKLVGAGRGVDDVLMVTLGTGIGAGLVVNGQLVRGAYGFAGEPGHMMVDPNGPPCPCGRQGCWERYASGSGLGRLGRDAAVADRARRVVELAGGDAEAVRGEHVTAAGREGDAEALAILEEFGRWLGRGIANIVNIFDPALVVVGGGLITDAELVLESARRNYADQVMGAAWRPEVPIVAAELRERAGAVGAGLLALHDSTG